MIFKNQSEFKNQGRQQTTIQTDTQKTRFIQNSTFWKDPLIAADVERGGGHPLNERVRCSFSFKSTIINNQQPLK